MPIPVAHAQDIVLGYIWLKAGAPGTPVPVEDLETDVVSFLSERGAIGFNGNGSGPSSIARSLRTLKRSYYVEYAPEDNAVKLTQLGAYVAGLYALPPELSDIVRSHNRV
jgi:hypothetical protein